MEPSELAEVLARGEEYLARSSWSALRDLVRSIPLPVAESEPDLLFFRALSEFNCGDLQQARRLTALMSTLSQRRPMDRAYRRAKHMEAACAIILGDLQVAEAALQDMAAVSEMGGDSEYEALAEMNLGIIYSIRWQHPRAILSYRKAASYWIRHRRWANTAGCYHNIGLSYREQGDLKAAEAAYRTARKYNKFLDEGSLQVALLRAELALLYCLRGDLQLSEITIKLMLAHPAVSQSEISRAEGLRVRGIVAARLGNAAEAMNNFREALRLARKNEIKMLRAELHEELSQLFAKEGVGRSKRHSRTAAAIYQQMGAEARAKAAGERVTERALAS
jgi:tetratricopeptide (TPR) repeat protein